MTRKLLAVLALILACLCPLAADDASVHWLTLPSAGMQINGLPWYGENGGALYRLPIKLKDTYNQPVWELAQDPSGGRIRFRTDSSLVAIRLEYPRPPAMKNMHAFGQSGVDLYADGVYRGTAIATPDSGPGKTIEFTYFKNQSRVDREITLYLPLYIPVKVLEIGLDAEARVQPAKAFAVSSPVVFYGTSITQGGCASRPGMSYQAILARMLNLDYVNLGFSGNGKGEPELARAVASLQASAFVLDFAQNNPTVDSLAQVFAPFLDVIRNGHPETPILVITPIYSVQESWSRNERLEGMRELIRTVAAKRIADGDRHLEIVEGTDLLGPSRGDGLVDGTHPNDLGFQWMADGLGSRLAKMLGLAAER
jgi:lysophospholipase L1-like esterase